MAGHNGEVARHWQMKNQRYNLIGTTCSCGRGTKLGVRPACRCENEQGKTDETFTFTVPAELAALAQHSDVAPTIISEMAA